MTAAGEGYVEVPGGRVWYRIVGSGPGVPLLCLHGGPGMPHDYLEPLEALGAQRPVVFYDQLGCGRSSGPTDPALFTIERHIDELDAVRDRLELAEVHILGHSWGGALAISYALCEPPGVRSYVFASPIFSTPEWEHDADRLRGELPPDVQETLTHHETHGYTTCPEYIEASMAYYRRHVLRMAPWPDCFERAFARVGPAYALMWGPTEFRCVGTLKTFDVTAQLNVVSTPSLFTCGRFDEATPETVGRWSEAISGSELAIFEQSGHLAHLEEEGPYREVVEEFIDRIDRRSP